MEIGGSSKNTSVDLSELYKSQENVKGTKPVEVSNLHGEKENSENEIKDAVKKLNKFLEDGTHLQYEKHDFFNQMIIKVVDNDTNQVIKEIPSRKILDVVAKMCEMAGVLVDKKA
ncbi:MAG TPA: flagellar protein FlaG [Clostridium sp.]|uniref:flagellar protein FlaG n=1 Tax=Clostridium sp. TaxID=1506 RepID=UPI002F950E4E